MDFNKIVDLLDREKKQTLLTQALLLLGPTAASPAASQSSERLAASAEGCRVEDKNSARNEPEGETSKYSADQLLQPVLKGVKETPAQKYFKVGVLHYNTAQVFD